MIPDEKKRGSSTVEAAILFPMIILLTVCGFSLMALWYHQWEVSLKEHEELRRESDYSENKTLLHWEQWEELLRDTDEGET